MDSIKKLFSKFKSGSNSKNDYQSVTIIDDIKLDPCSTQQEDAFPPTYDHKTIPVLSPEKTLSKQSLHELATISKYNIDNIDNIDNLNEMIFDDLMKIINIWIYNICIRYIITVDLKPSISKNYKINYVLSYCILNNSMNKTIHISITAKTPQIKDAIQKYISDSYLNNYIYFDNNDKELAWGPVRVFDICKEDPINYNNGIYLWITYDLINKNKYKDVKTDNASLQQLIKTYEMMAKYVITDKLIKNIETHIYQQAKKGLFTYEYKQNILSISHVDILYGYIKHMNAFNDVECKLDGERIIFSW